MKSLYRSGFLTVVLYKIRKYLERPVFTNSDASSVVRDNHLDSQERILNYVKKHTVSFARLSRIVEMANSERDNTAAYYTRQDICFGIVNNLPDAKNYSNLSILEPSIGVGNFLPSLIEKYSTWG